LSPLLGQLLRRQQWIVLDELLESRLVGSLDHTRLFEPRHIDVMIVFPFQRHSKWKLARDDVFLLHCCPSRGLPNNYRAAAGSVALCLSANAE
jgi:hypothetical protein